MEEEKVKESSASKSKQKESKVDNREDKRIDILKNQLESLNEKLTHERDKRWQNEHDRIEVQILELQEQQATLKKQQKLGDTRTVRYRNHRGSEELNRTMRKGYEMMMASTNTTKVVSNGQEMFSTSNVEGVSTRTVTHGSARMSSYSSDASGSERDTSTSTETTSHRVLVTTRRRNDIVRLSRYGLSMVPAATRILSFSGIGFFTIGAILTASNSPKTALGLGSGSLFSSIVNILMEGQWQRYREIRALNRRNQFLVDELNELPGKMAVTRTMSVSSVFSGLKLGILAIADTISAILILTSSGIAISESNNDTSPLSWTAAVGALGVFLFTLMHVLVGEILLSTLSKLKTEESDLLAHTEERHDEQVKLLKDELDLLKNRLPTT